MSNASSKLSTHLTPAVLEDDTQMRIDMYYEYKSLGSGRRAVSVPLGRPSTSDLLVFLGKADRQYSC